MLCVKIWYQMSWQGLICFIPNICVSPISLPMQGLPVELKPSSFWMPYTQEKSYLNSKLEYKHFIYDSLNVRIERRQLLLLLETLTAKRELVCDKAWWNWTWDYWKQKNSVGCQTSTSQFFIWAHFLRVYWFGTNCRENDSRHSTFKAKIFSHFKVCSSRKRKLK